jgi:hypothetical protein
MGEDDVRGAYVWLQRLACNPYADNDSPVVIHGTPPGISAARASPVTSTPQSLCTHCACLSEHFGAVWSVAAAGCDHVGTTSAPLHRHTSIIP